MKTSQKPQNLASMLALSVAAALLGAVTVAQAQVINNPVQPSAITPNQQAIEVGPVLDVIPYVLADG